MSYWTSLAVFYALAIALAIGVMVHAGWLQARRPESRRVLPDMFPWLNERSTYANAVSIARYSRERPAAWAVFVFASAPSVAAVITALFGSDVAGISALGRRFLPWTDDVATGGALATYAAILVVFVVVAMAYLRVARNAPADEQPVILHNRSAGRVWALLLGGIFVDEGGTLEELGWRGFALPVLAVATGSLWWATLVLAVGWWAWHLPREVPSLMHRRKWGTFAALQGQFVVLCVTLSALATVAWVHTGSVWPAILIHGGTNVWSKALGGPMWSRTKVDVRSRVCCGLAVVVVAAEVLL